MKLISEFSRRSTKSDGTAVLTTGLQLGDSKENCGSLPYLTVPGKGGELLFLRHFHTSPPKRIRTEVTRPEVWRTLLLLDTGKHILGANLKRHKCATNFPVIECVDVLNKARPISKKSHTKAERIVIRYLRAYLARRDMLSRQSRPLQREHLSQSPDQWKTVPYLSVSFATSTREGSNLVFERVYDEVQGANMLRLRPVHVTHPLFKTLTRTRMVMIACGDILDASRPIGHLSRDQQTLVECVRAHLARSLQMSGYVSSPLIRAAGKR